MPFEPVEDKELAQPKAEVEVTSDQSAPSADVVKLWKSRYNSAKQFWKEHEWTKSCETIRDCLKGKFYDKPSDDPRVYVNQFLIALKSKIPSIVYREPELDFEPFNDYVFEYARDEAGNFAKDESGEFVVLKGDDGKPIKHDMQEASRTLKTVINRRLRDQKPVWKKELRKALLYAAAYGRAILISGHTVNSGYDGMHQRQPFHAFQIAPSPLKVLRQPGTALIEQGLYAFHEYTRPMSLLKQDASINQELLKKCSTEVLKNIDLKENESDPKLGLYDDVKYVKLRDAYDLVTGEVFLFGEGQDQALKISKRNYRATNPFTEWVPNLEYIPDIDEPPSDLMAAMNTLTIAHDILNKMLNHVLKFNTGLIVEETALTPKQRDKIEKSRNLAIWTVKDKTVTGQRFKERSMIDFGQTPWQMLNFLMNMIERQLSVFDFDQGGGQREDETATKTQGKIQSANIQRSDTAESFGDFIATACEKYADVVLKSTTEEEVVKIVGDAAEVEYKKFNADEADRGQYYCRVNVESMAKQDKAVETQQRLKLLEIINGDPDPEMRRRIDKAKLYKQISDGLNLEGSGLLKDDPNQMGMSDEAYAQYVMNQRERARAENEIAKKGLPPPPPADSDDDDIHLQTHLDDFKLTGSIPLKEHMALHIGRKKAQEAEGGEAGAPAPVLPGPQIAPNPPSPGQLAGEAARVPGTPPGMPGPQPRPM